MASSKYDVILKDFRQCVNTDPVNFLKAVSGTVSKHRHTRLKLHSPEDSVLRIGDLDDTQYRNNPEVVDDCCDFFLTKQVDMEVLGVVEDILPLGQELLVMVSEDKKVYGYDGLKLHLVASNLEELFESGVHYPGTETYSRGESFKDTTQAEWAEVWQSDAMKNMDKMHKALVNKSRREREERQTGGLKMEGQFGIAPPPSYEQSQRDYSTVTHLHSTELNIDDYSTVTPPPSHLHYTELNIEDYSTVIPPPSHIHSTELNIEVPLLKEDQIYLSNPSETRLALLINNQEFKGVPRQGAVQDEEHLKRTFTALGYTVVAYRDISAQDMEIAVKEFCQREEHHRADSTFVVIMSYGDGNDIFGKHWQEEDPESDVFRINHIFTSLSAANCKALIDKPKFVLVYAYESASQFTHGPRREPMEQENNLKSEGFALLQTVIPDDVSYRQDNKDEEGHSCSIIQQMAKIFNTYAWEEDVTKIFQRVIFQDAMAPEWIPPIRKFHHSLEKKFYLCASEASCSALYL